MKRTLRNLMMGAVLAMTCPASLAGEAITVPVGIYDRVTQALIAAATVSPSASNPR